MENQQNVRLAGIAYESLVNGPGMRRVLFAQGCPHNCKGCFNQDTHSFEGGALINMDEIVKDIIENPFVKGVTFSGGDPLEQADKFAFIAKELKKANKNIWCYTGYTFDYILEHINERRGWKELLQYIDVLVDGRFEESLKQEGLKFRGSSNQRVIDVQESLSQNKIVLMKI
ncbi:anaerobic ribonucleoside-triphosphate reductase activating protein [Clostridium sp. 19966]|uniref:anaerobic ribonucleoside-triphosphate reductase activating protein n=1 Tax=Clostridium sp. 19966 TaxID=2768166 RepID=UPI0028DE8B04|nr:anaerobic ribonucleoside-triphosphate reductase activating protein [Clostridium sp. 19966]MDT8717288.1 anaerobic ribonucleoside-triphosphate reductase activating protein [Clostridium sp. 19966]